MIVSSEKQSWEIAIETCIQIINGISILQEEFLDNESKMSKE